MHLFLLNSSNLKSIIYDNFLHFKVTCKSPCKFGITMQLCDNLFWQGWSLNHRDIRAWVKEYAKESSTSYGTNCISGTNGHC